MRSIKGYSHTTMVRLANRLITRDYRTKARFCDAHKIDRGNLSRALGGKGVLTDEMLAPLGFFKEYVPVYKKLPDGTSSEEG